MEKFKSRKLWVTFLAVALQMFGPLFGMNQEAIETVIKLAGFYIGSQGLVDAVAMLKQK